MSNFQIETVINGSENENLKNNFIDVFLSDKMNKFVIFHSMMRKNQMQNIMFSVIDTTKTEEAYWWRILNILSMSNDWKSL